jgi:hypothetical protein
VIWFIILCSDNKRDRRPQQQPGPSRRSTEPPSPSNNPHPHPGNQVPQDNVPTTSANTSVGGSGGSNSKSLNQAEEASSSSSSSNSKGFVFTSKPKNKKLKLIEEHDHALAEVLQNEEESIANAIALSRQEIVSIRKSKRVTTSRPSASGSEGNKMDSSEEYEDSGNESSGEDVEFAMEANDRGPNEVNPEDEYPFTVLSTKDIVEHMVDSIREVKSGQL